MEKRLIIILLKNNLSVDIHESLFQGNNIIAIKFKSPLRETQFTPCLIVKKSKS